MRQVPGYDTQWIGCGDGGIEAVEQEFTGVHIAPVAAFAGHERGNEPSTLFR